MSTASSTFIMYLPAKPQRDKLDIRSHVAFHFYMTGIIKGHTQIGSAHCELQAKSVVLPYTLSQP